MSTGAIVRRGLLLAVTAASLYLLFPALLNVFGAWDRLEDINPLWFPAMVALQVGSYGCMWAVQRLSLRTRAWGPVITSQLASNAFGRVVPGGVAASGALQYSMLTKAGISPAAAASGMTASSVLVFATLCLLPVLAVPAILGGAPVDPGLARAAVIGAGVFVLMFLLGAVCVLFDRPLIVVGRAAQWVLNRVRRGEERTGVPKRLLGERDVVLEVLGAKWWQALLFSTGRWLLDFATLLAALSAVGAHPRPSLVLLAFFAAQMLGTLPLTPGGLGFVEAGLTGTLALAGVGASQAVLATLAYRLVSFWLPIPAGGVTALLHRRHERMAEPASGAGG